LGFGAAGVADAVVALTPLAAEVPPLTATGAEFAEPVAFVCVVEIGPATAAEVSDVVLFADACVVDPVWLLFAADADLVPPLHPTAAARAIEMRTERYIFLK
jgi:hypothetical protein